MKYWFVIKASSLIQSLRNGWATSKLDVAVTLKQRSIFFSKMYFYVLISFPITVIFLHYTDPVQWIFNQHCVCWWPGALAPRHQHPQCWVWTHVFLAIYGLTEQLECLRSDIWNGSDKYCRRYRADTILSTHGQMDRQTDGQGETSIPPFNFFEVGV